MRIKDKIKAVICIATFHRPEGLSRLLQSLSDLQFDKCPGTTWQVVVVDNEHPAYPAREIVHNYRKTFPVDIIYGTEHLQGLVSARNKTIQLAPESEFIVIVDDDEVVTPCWLDELLIVQEKSNAGIVAGSVLPIYECSPSKWIVRGGFFTRKRHQTGTEHKYASGGNVLIQREWLEQVEGPYDIRMNLLGGADTLLTHQLFTMGAKIVWADEATTSEYIPANRMTISWLLKRSFRFGITIAQVDSWVYHSWNKIILRLIKGFVRILLGLTLLIPWSIFSGLVGFVKSLQMITHGVGELISFLGIQYEEYKYS